MIDRLRGRQEWQFFRALRRAAPAYAIGWWILVVLRGTLPAVTSVAFGWLVSAITRESGASSERVAVIRERLESQRPGRGKRKLPFRK